MDDHARDGEAILRDAVPYATALIAASLEAARSPTDAGQGMQAALDGMERWCFEPDDEGARQRRVLALAASLANICVIYGQWLTTEVAQWEGEREALVDWMSGFLPRALSLIEHRGHSTGHWETLS